VRRYFLPLSVHACIPDDSAIFLNLSQNRYFGLDRDQTRLFRRLLQGDLDADTEALAAELVSKSLLTTQPRYSRILCLPSIEMPERSLVPAEIYDPPASSIGHFSNFIAACLAVATALRGRSLHCAVTRFATLKARMPGNDGFKSEQTQTLLKIFRHCRPIIYAARDNCLFDSLVLGDFLRRYGVSSTCVFGVRTMPFAAHCWIQTNKCVLNGIPEIVNRYVPILSV